MQNFILPPVPDLLHHHGDIRGRHPCRARDLADELALDGVELRPGHGERQGQGDVALGGALEAAPADAAGGGHGARRLGDRVGRAALGAPGLPRAVGVERARGAGDLARAAEARVAHALGDVGRAARRARGGLARVRRARGARPAREARAIVPGVAGAGGHVGRAALVAGARGRGHPRARPARRAREARAKVARVAGAGGHVGRAPRRAGPSGHRQRGARPAQSARVPVPVVARVAPARGGVRQAAQTAGGGRVRVRPARPAGRAAQPVAKVPRVARARRDVGRGVGWAEVRQERVRGARTARSARRKPRAEVPRVARADRGVAGRVGRAARREVAVGRACLARCARGSAHVVTRVALARGRVAGGPHGTVDVYVAVWTGPARHARGPTQVVVLRADALAQAGGTGGQRGRPHGARGALGCPIGDGVGPQSTEGTNSTSQVRSSIARHCATGGIRPRSSKCSIGSRVVGTGRAGRGGGGVCVVPNCTCCAHHCVARGIAKADHVLPRCAEGALDTRSPHCKPFGSIGAPQRRKGVYCFDLSGQQVH